MSLPCVDLRLPDGRTLRAHPGAILGRLATSAARIDDPRLHEAHALLSHRGEKLWLIALMTRFIVDGRREREVALRPGVRVWLLDDFPVDVERVALPRQLWALEARGPRAEAWVRLGALNLDEHYTVTPEPGLATGELAHALWHLWSNGVGWTLRAPGRSPVSLTAGKVWEHDGWQLRAVQVDAPASSTPATLVDGQIYLPFDVEIEGERVTIRPEGQPAFTLTGHSAYILRALSAAGGDGWVDWTSLAEARWRSVRKWEQLANLWYKALSRLRDKLQEHQIDPAWVASDGDRRVRLDPALREGYRARGEVGDGGEAPLG